uniref:Translocation protein SEC62 n=1 Tax=Clastoptera arizonana TaxID=38151 RepID=A0A1B6CC81_9HEMI
MAEKRKGKKRKEDIAPHDEKEEKTSKEEYAVAKWLKQKVPVKRTKFLNHNVEYFTGSKAVDALLEQSPWTKPSKSGDDPLFITRSDVIDFLDLMLRHKFFHRAKKVPVSEQELRAKSKKKDKKDDKKTDDKKKKDDDAAESSHAEGKETQTQDERDKKKRKIRLEMHYDQFFEDCLDAYVWIYDPIPVYYWLFGALLVLGAIGICMFPLWPPTVRMGVYYLSVAAAGFLMFIIALAALRLIVFCLLWVMTLGAHHLWLFPNLTEDVGFFASFWPLYQYEYKGKGGDRKGKKKKKDKDSDNEEDEKTEKEDEEDDDEDGNSENKADDERNLNDEGSGDKEGSATNEKDSETESENSSQQSQTGKDFEMVDREEVKDS